MQCAISPRAHLLRGLIAFALLVLAFARAWPTWAFLSMLIEAFLLLRGCPMCWLLDYIRLRRQIRR